MTRGSCGKPAGWLNVGSYLWQIWTRPAFFSEKTLGLSGMFLAARPDSTNYFIGQGYAQ